LLAVTSFVVPSTLGAQIARAGQVELSALGIISRFGSDAPALSPRVGGGGALGLYLSRRLSLEANADFTLTRDTASLDEVQLARVGGGLYGHLGGAGVGRLFLGLGYSRMVYRGAAHHEDGGFFAVLGDHLSLGGRAALRLEGRLTYVSGSALTADTGSSLTLGAAAGLSIFAFGGPPRDADHDRVADRRDRCPDTPMGATVDPSGCPMDSDGDAVLNGLDQCPDTPAGAQVDPAGCPTDADQDAVFDGLDDCPNTPTGAAVDAKGCPTDADRDGVFDGLDRCPDTPQGALVDESGCPGDADGDRVFDGIDQCPNTPAGIPVDETGCPSDTDRDGVVNALDECPETPAGVEVDARGCPIERDADADGVPDGRDRCPNTAPGQNIDAVGCPILFAVAEEGRVRPLVLRGVNFQTGRSALTPESFAVLDEVALSLVAHPEVRIEIGGHTDSTGSRATNQRLSLQRAQAVMAYLARKGVAPSRMVARGYGPDEPIAPNNTSAGRAQNRRVELRLLEGDTSR
jgi:outer membrane protein OmpA-like peptidoglycan-associated protein